VPLLANIVAGRYLADRTTTPVPNTLEDNESWYLPVSLLILLRGFAIYTMYSLFGHVQDFDIYPDTAVYFVVLPLASVLVDNMAALSLGIEAWREIIPSILFNYFLTRSLAMIAGHKISAACGQRALGISLMASAICLSIPRMSRKYLLEFILKILTLRQ
jgi:hypothetical protein